MEANSTLEHFAHTLHYTTFIPCERNIEYHLAAFPRTFNMKLWFFHMALSYCRFFNIITTKSKAVTISRPFVSFCLFSLCLQFLLTVVSTVCNSCVFHTELLMSDEKFRTSGDMKFDLSTGTDWK